MAIRPPGPLPARIVIRNHVHAAADYLIGATDYQLGATDYLYIIT